ncbi:hypothetical protein IG193_05560 [Infirmifilum lucidum]|uniref:Uncharacterized protein n=1 Tax=Infirmifilum lucidum TaxID=2776706 RepID=A0A7L9FEX4_9CREN|nr:hypothetical protein [Infirmifilum lucidum]QOJ78237.1 hypothetical protein IG193_05560 [Infirmifilum lucidum]
MPEKKRKEEKQPPAIDLTAFLSTQEQQPSKAEGKAASASREALLTEEVERALLQRIRQEPGGLTRSQLYEWSKKKGVSPAVFYKALTSLVEKGLVQRRFDSTREEYVFVTTQ